MESLHTSEELEAALEEPVAVLLKYSTTCPISANARREVLAFEARNPDQPVYGVDVHEAAELSAAIVERLGVAHESPQAFILRDGEPVWTAAHYDVSADALEKELAAVDE